MIFQQFLHFYLFECGACCLSSNMTTVRSAPPKILVLHCHSVGRPLVSSFFYWNILFHLSLGLYGDRWSVLQHCPLHNIAILFCSPISIYFLSCNFSSRTNQIFSIHADIFNNTILKLWYCIFIFTMTFMVVPHKI